MSFDPEKVERVTAEADFTDDDGERRYWDYDVVRASDYDQLLALYREATKGVEMMRCEDCGERARVTHVPRRAVTCPACKEMTLVRE